MYLPVYLLDSNHLQKGILLFVFVIYSTCKALDKT